MTGRTIRSARIYGSVYICDYGFDIRSLFKSKIMKYLTFILILGIGCCSCDIQPEDRDVLAQVVEDSILVIDQTDEPPGDPPEPPRCDTCGVVTNWDNFLTRLNDIKMLDGAVLIDTSRITERSIIDVDLVRTVNYQVDNACVLIYVERFDRRDSVFSVLFSSGEIFDDLGVGHNALRLYFHADDGTLRGKINSLGSDEVYFGPLRDGMLVGVTTFEDEYRIYVGGSVNEFIDFEPWYSETNSYPGTPIYLLHERFQDKTVNIGHSVIRFIYIGLAGTRGQYKQLEELIERYLL